MLLKDLQHIFHLGLDAIYEKEEVDSFFYLCTEHYLNLSRVHFVLEPKFTITKFEIDVFFQVLEDLKQQKPIQYILGETEFYGLPFNVNEQVLIPRPETEELVALIIKNVKTQKPSSNTIKILDIGTGSGCIAVSLAKNLPTAKVFALDVSKEALKVAQQNAQLNSIELTYILADLLNKEAWDLAFRDLEFDIIVSNPPYVRALEKAEIQSNVLDYEPHLALFVDDSSPLIFYKAILDFAIDYLKPKGVLYFEINQYLGEETKRLLVDAHFDTIELIKDLYGNDRMLTGTRM